MEPILFQLTTILLQEPVTTVQQQANWTSVAMALIGIVPSSIAAIVAGMAFLQSRRNSEVAARTDIKVEKGIEKSDVIIEKTTEIHTLTNSNLSKVTAQLEMANQKLEQSDSRMKKLEEMVTRLTPGVTDITTAKLDQIVATGGRIEAGNMVVADELAASKERAAAVDSDEAGAAADAAALNPPK